jgi:GNAT superfamily N-acetyltransferase
VGVVVVRAAQVSHAEDIVEVGRLVDPTALSNAEMFRALLERGDPPTTQRLVALSEARVVAWSPSGLYQSGSAWFSIVVHPEFRNRGIGTAIYDHVEERLRLSGADSLATSPTDEAGRSFLIERGFELSGTVRASEIDPRTVAAPAETPVGCEVVSLRDAFGDPEPLFDLYSEARADVPSLAPRPEWSFAEWRSETLDHPLIDLDASVVVLESGEPVALAWLYSDRDGRRAETLMAATRRERRGRGFATLAKIESTRRAAALGITRILTGNDTGNEPMLAINDKLGFTATVLIENYSKPLAG